MDTIIKHRIKALCITYTVITAMYYFLFSQQIEFFWYTATISFAFLIYILITTLIPFKGEVKLDDESYAGESRINEGPVLSFFIVFITWIALLSFPYNIIGLLIYFTTSFILCTKKSTN